MLGGPLFVCALQPALLVIANRYCGPGGGVRLNCSHILIYPAVKAYMREHRANTPCAITNITLTLPVMRRFEGKRRAKHGSVGQT
jgi:hypothetical protein